MTTSKSLFLYMVLGIAIGAVLFIIYEKQRHSVPIDGEIDGFKDISNVYESNQYFGKYMQDHNLQTNENKGSKTCPHKYVDISHFQDGILMKNKNASGLLFCTKDGYPNSQSCPTNNTCGSCISYKKEFKTIDSETSKKYNTLNKSIENQKKVFDTLDEPIQQTVNALKSEIGRRKRLIGKVTKNIEDAKELEASIKTLEEKKEVYDAATNYCKSQPNSRFYKNIIARQTDPGKNFRDLQNVEHDSVPPPNNNPYKCWSNHQVQTLHWLPSSDYCQVKWGKSPNWSGRAKKFEDVKTIPQYYNEDPTPFGAAISSTEMKNMPDACDKINQNNLSYHNTTDGRLYVLKDNFSSSYKKREGDCEQNNIQEFKKTTFDECKQLCNNIKNCKGFSYSKKDNQCYPKNATCTDEQLKKKGTNYTFYQLNE